MKGKKGVVVIKLGSSTVTKDDGPDEAVIGSVCAQAVSLISKGYGVSIVTSGAIACDPDVTCSKNLRAATGQLVMMAAYVKYFNPLGIKCGQMLLTDDKFQGLRAKQTKETLLEAYSKGSVLILNANDPVDNEEIQALKLCADNDMLFKLVCLLVGADIGIIGFDELGFLRDGQLVTQIKPSEMPEALKHAQGGNGKGHGKSGMKTKIEVLSELAQRGIRAHLVPGRAENFVLRAVAGEEGFGTTFLP